MEPYLLYRDSSTDGKKSYAFPRDVIKDLNLDIIFLRFGHFLVQNAPKLAFLRLKRTFQVVFLCTFFDMTSNFTL